MFKRIALVSMALLPLHLCLALADFIPPGTNIALKKSYSWNVEPSYKLGLDPEGDKTHLTDGVYVPGCGWTDKRTVGWDYRQAPVEITIDLGEVKPIAGISYSTAAGSACITWPVNIIVLTSDDGKEFYFAGDLTMLALHNAPVPVVGAYRYATDRLATRGRYVRLVIVALQYIFCDEIEIYRGDDGLLKGPRRDKPFTGVDAYIKEYATTLGVQKRILQDISELRQRLTASDVAADRKSSAFKALDELAILTPTVQVDDPLTFRCIFPFGDIHQRVYAQNRFLLQSAGVTNISIRTGDRWKPLSPFDIPAGGAPEINIRMMRGEYRAAVVNITNPTSNQVDIAMRFEGLPGTTAPYWIEPHEVLFMDSQYGRVLADALMPIPAQHGDRYELTLPAGMTKLFRFFGYFRDSYELRLPPGMAKYAGRYLARVELYKLALPAGMTKQVWLRFAPPARMNPGDYKGRLLINAGSVCQTVPLNIYISRLEFPVQPRLTQLWCDYTDGISYDFKALGEDSLPLAVSNLQKYFVDQTWAHAGASGMPGADYYNKRTNLRSHSISPVLMPGLTAGQALPTTMWSF
ncbi:MAG: discoidin domain-containing protein [Verrucomicrobia bacterium]|nr:discoidin domain-containing protein [Verrucomicrobiota bacterium]